MSSVAAARVGEHSLNKSIPLAHCSLIAPGFDPPQREGAMSRKVSIDAVMVVGCGTLECLPGLRDGIGIQADDPVLHHVIAVGATKITLSQVGNGLTREGYNYPRPASILYHSILYHSTLCHTIVYHSTLYHTILYYIPCYNMLYHTIPYHTVKCHTIPYMVCYNYPGPPAEPPKEPKMMAQYLKIESIGSIGSNILAILEVQASTVSFVKGLSQTCLAPEGLPVGWADQPASSPERQQTALHPSKVLGSL